GADMSRFICRYSAYVQEKAIAYRSLAFDFCKIKRGSEDAVLRTMSADKLLKSLPDATRLFVAFNDGIINLLSKFFELWARSSAKSRWMIYRKFVTRSERLNEFSKRSTSSFLEAMESHLAHTRRPLQAGGQQSAAGLGGFGMPRSASSSGGLGAPSSSAAAPKLSQVLLEEQQQLDRLKAEQMQRQTAANAAAKPAQAPASHRRLSVCQQRHPAAPASPFVANFPALNNAVPQKQQRGSGITGDLDSSLAWTLVGNLNMRQGGQYSQGGKQQAVNWAVGSSSSTNSSSVASSSVAFGRTAAAGGVGGGVKISAGPTVNWDSSPSIGCFVRYGAQSMGFLHTQSQPAFRMSPQQMQQQQQAGWHQQAANQQPNPNDPFGAL
uniref:ANTH domain-containing protein n=1 Tax=Macrostomum lignano TaxID=282301 RepID=A0A1I8FLZ8_9PLAT